MFTLKDQHGVTVGIEPIALMDRVLIGLFSKGLSHEGRYQKKQCGLWQMKIGEQMVHDFKLKRRLDKKIRLAFPSD